MEVGRGVGATETVATGRGGNHGSVGAPGGKVGRGKALEVTGQRVGWYGCVRVLVWERVLLDLTETLGIKLESWGNKTRGWRTGRSSLCLQR